MSYADLLKDPRWQKKRLEVMDRAGFKCELCGNSEKELHVHHTKYNARCLPWEYDNSTLLCICDICHGKLHGKLPESIPPVAVERAISRHDESLITFLLSCPEEASFLEATDFEDPAVFECKGVSDKYPTPDVLELTSGDIERVRRNVMGHRIQRERKARLLRAVKTGA
jgi:hypothetical protein